MTAKLYILLLVERLNSTVKGSEKKKELNNDGKQMLWPRHATWLVAVEPVCHLVRLSSSFFSILARASFSFFSSINSSSCCCIFAAPADDLFCCFVRALIGGSFMDAFALWWAWGRMAGSGATSWSQLMACVMLQPFTRILTSSSHWILSHELTENSIS